jgi:hypothetical protein
MVIYRATTTRTYFLAIRVNIPGEGVAMMFPWILFPQIVRITRRGPSKDRYYEHNYGPHRWLLR